MPRRVGPMKTMGTLTGRSAEAPPVREHRQNQRGAQDFVQQGGPRLPDVAREEKLRTAGDHQRRQP